MKSKWMLFFAALFSYQTATCQDQELSEEDFLMMSEFVYDMCTSIFKEKNYVYKEAPFEKHDFFDPVPSTDQVDRLVQLIKKEGKITIEKDDFGPQLVFSVKLEENDSELFDNLEKLSLEESNLINEHQQKLELQGFYSVYRTSEVYKLVGSIDKETYDTAATLSGNATYHFDILVGYDQVKLSKSHVGKTFSLDNCTFKLVDIVSNQIILEPMCDKDLSVKLINFAKPDVVYESYAYDELMEMKEKDASINTEGSFTQSSQTIDKKLFDTFKKNPRFSLKKFRKMLTKKEIERLSKEESIYLVLEHVAPIGNTFVLFSPKFQSEEVSVNFQY